MFNVLKRLQLQYFNTRQIRPCVLYSYSYCQIKSSTTALIFSVQEQALRTNYTKFHIDKTSESPLFRLCGIKGESISHLISECSKLTQKQYKERHDSVAQNIHWELCGMYGTALIFSVQEQALRTNYTKFHTDRTSESPLCRLCGIKGESILHIISECSKLAQKQYKERHDSVAQNIHWELCGMYGFERENKWYDHIPQSVIENEETKILWDFTIQFDRYVQNRRSDIVVIKKSKQECKIIDIAVPNDDGVGSKEQEKIEKYQDLRQEIAHLWGMKKVQVIPIVIGALGMISQKPETWLGKIGVSIRTETLQKSTLLGTARILRRTLEM